MSRAKKTLCVSILGVILLYSLILFALWLSRVITGDRYEAIENGRIVSTLTTDYFTWPEDIEKWIDSLNLTGEIKRYTRVGHKLIGEMTLVRGALEGAHREWYQNGSLFSYNFFTNGVRHCASTNYFPNGLPQYTSYYDHGVQLQSTAWYENGNPRSEHTHTTSGVLCRERHWTKEGKLFADAWFDISCNATSGIVCVQGISDETPPILLDAVGQTNVSFSAAIEFLTRTTQ